MKTFFDSTPRLTAAIAFFVALAAFPLLGLDFYNEMVARIIILSIFAVSLDLLVGYTGLVSLGHAAWFGLGGYTFALLSTQYKLSTSLWVTLPAAMVVTAFLAAIVGLFVLRTKGIFFIMVTLAFAQVFYFLFHDVQAIGGSSDGINLYSKPTATLGDVTVLDLQNPTTLYYFILIVMILVITGLSVLLRSPFGRAIQGIRENEHRMRSIGYPVFRYKLATFTLAGAIAGLAGYLFAVLSDGVNPELLSWHQSADVLLMLIFGGIGQVWGGIIGAFVFVLLKELLMSTTTLWQLWLGLIIVLTVLFLPDGLVSLLDRIKLLLGKRTHALLPKVTKSLSGRKA
jgi:branched-chain amino acid transport system permease protein